MATDETISSNMCLSRKLFIAPIFFIFQCNNIASVHGQTTTYEITTVNSTLVAARFNGTTELTTIFSGDTETSTIRKYTSQAVTTNGTAMLNASSSNATAKMPMTPSFTTTARSCPASCPGNSTCSNSTFVCECEPGFTLMPSGCIDINECENNRTCDINNGEECTNIPGSYACECREGFNEVSPGGGCEKVCPPTCPYNSKCKNASEGCKCNPGYGGPVNNCTDINECNDEPCNQGKECKNLEGSYTCVCPDGEYELVDGGCEKESADCGECGEHAVCTDSGCQCTIGWEKGPDGQCEDVDECLSACQQPTQLCVNTAGSYRCTCIDGYQETGGERNDPHCVPVQCIERTVPCPSNPDCESVEFLPTLAGYSNSSNTSCPEDTVNVGKPCATALCSLTGAWQTLTCLTSCSEGIESLANSTIQTDEERETVSGSLEVLTSEPETLDPEDIRQSTEVIQEILDTSNIKSTVADSLVSSIGNLIEAPSISEDDASNELLDLLNNVSRKIVLGENETYSRVNNNVSLIVSEVSSVSKKNLPGIGIIVLVRPNSIALGFRDDQLQIANNSETAGDFNNGNRIQASIFLPAKTAERGSRTAFITFGNTNIFVRSNSTAEDKGADFISRNAEVAESLVLSSTIEGVDIQDLADSERIQFSIMRNGSNRLEDFCAFWDESNLQWSDMGCEIDTNTDEGVVSCVCNHLTSFAALLGPVNTAALETITIVGCSISSFGLFLVIVAFALVEDTRKGKRLRAAFLLTCLCIALLGLNICLIISNTDYIEEDDKACFNVAVAMHFFLISSCAWMNCEAANLYLAIMKPIYAKHVLRNSNVFIFTSLWGWIMPAIYVVTISQVKEDWYINDEICWINYEQIIYIVVIPLAIQVTFNLVIYVILTINLQLTNDAVKNQKWAKKRLLRRRRIAINVSIFVTVGVTWVFGLFIPVFLKDPDVAEIFAYIFTILNSLQGAILFLLYIVRSREVQRSLRMEFSKLSSSLGFSRTSDWTSENYHSERSQERKQKVKGIRYLTRTLTNVFQNSSTAEEDNQQ